MIELVVAAVEVLRTQPGASDQWYQQKEWRGWDSIGQIVPVDPVWIAMVEFDSRVALLKIHPSGLVVVQTSDGDGADWEGVLYTASDPSEVASLMRKALRLLGEGNDC